MPRKRKQKIKLNNTEALEGLLQETYNDACANINSAQSTINEMANAAEPQDVDDLTKIAREKTSALKVKDSAMKIKLEIAKLQSATISNGGDTEEAVQQRSGGKVSLSDFQAVRKMMEEKGQQDNTEETDE